MRVKQASKRNRGAGKEGQDSGPRDASNDCLYKHSTKNCTGRRPAARLGHCCCCCRNHRRLARGLVCLRSLLSHHWLTPPTLLHRLRPALLTASNVLVQRILKREMKWLRLLWVQVDGTQTDQARTRFDSQLAQCEYPPQWQTKSS